MRKTRIVINGKNLNRKCLNLKKSAEHLHKSKKILIFAAKLRDNEKNPEDIAYQVLHEVMFAGTDKKSSDAISKLLKQGKIRRIAPKIYTTNFEANGEDIVRRNIFSILGRLYPGAIDEREMTERQIIKNERRKQNIQATTYGEISRHTY